MYNPSLRREPRYEPASVIPLKQDNSILEWLRSSGRLTARDDKEDPTVILGDDDLEGIMSGDGFDDEEDFGSLEDNDDDADDDDLS